MDPRDFRRWVFLTLTLSLAHFAPAQRLMQLSGLAVYRGFFTFADVREWDDFMRIPALIQQTWFAWSWPGAVLLFLAPAGNGRVLAWIAATPFAAYAMLRVVLAVAWSESYLPFAGFYEFSQANATLFFAMGLLAVSLYSWNLGRLPGTIATLASACTLTLLLFLPVAPFFREVGTSTLKPVFLVQWMWRTPGSVVPFALLGYWLAFLVASRPGTTQRVALFGCLPLLALSVAMAIDWIDALHTTDWWYFGRLEWPRMLPFYIVAALTAIACSALPRSKSESPPSEKCVCGAFGLDATLEKEIPVLPDQQHAHNKSRRSGRSQPPGNQRMAGGPG